MENHAAAAHVAYPAVDARTRPLVDAVEAQDPRTTPKGDSLSARWNYPGSSPVTAHAGMSAGGNPDPHDPVTSP